MSKWTHILGVIRFDSIATVIHPAPWNKKFIQDAETAMITEVFRSDVPAGSEGPIEVQIVRTERGPAVIMVGDLRDFGRDDIGSVLDWIKQSIDVMSDACKRQKIAMIVRDMSVTCEVEFDDNTYLITLKDGRPVMEMFTLEGGSHVS